METTTGVWYTQPNSIVYNLHKINTQLLNFDLNTPISTIVKSDISKCLGHLIEE